MIHKTGQVIGCLRRSSILMLPLALAAVLLAKIILCLLVITWNLRAVHYKTCARIACLDIASCGSESKTLVAVHVLSAHPFSDLLLLWLPERLLDCFPALPRFAHKINNRPQDGGP